MRFEQLKRESNVILHKKLYKKGKNWIVSSTLIFAGAMILMNCNATTVNADTLTDSTETVVPSNNQTDQPTTSVTPNNVIADEPVNNALSSQSATVTKSTNDDLTTENTANNTPVETGSATQTNTADKQTNNYNFQNSSTNLVSSKNTSLPEVQASTNTSTQSTPEYTIANTARLKNFNYSVSGTTLFIKGIGDDTLIDTLAFRTNNEISNTLTADNIDTNSITKIDTSQGTPLNVHNSSNLFGNTSESNFNKYSAFPNVTDFDLSGMKLNPYNLPTSSKPPIQNTLLNTFGYSHLKTLDFTSANWDTSTFLNFNSMFTGTKDLAQINGLEFFDTANAIYMSNMFNGSGLTSLDISNFNMSKVTSKVNMLANMSNLTSIKLGNGDNIAGTGLSDIGPDYVWVNVKNPKDALSSADLMTRYNGTGNPDVDTFRKEPVNYKVADVTIQTSLGDKTVKNIFGSIGSTVSVAVPSEDGYTADKNTVDAFISDDGIAIVDPGGAGFVTYNPKTVVGDVIIHTSLGDKSAKTSGEVGSTIPVTVPNIDGYTPD
ncbi:BspA family leucine-rich repeat surface protein, partial [Companilactobacillus kimchiensis]|uniref:BspA family leucine-rich repeat surface protein n=1 Tax=Companilactobacillus kimchiensis TaxID=993692 RepID=UPI000B2DCFFA